ncbi:hypothetical protein QEJ31_05605 [Pigmentibacter sp. JX0631]|uniref:hypothetical protein n=1 Tax=Pigmentibacter sp. JX0631 TaxID=2976982 RepID=UPI0024683D56|nr:hypothetical protein [Pigmentibacter sp. JX0631]WGL61069.1 hypothetical protein QEJ31_05605 [Pigmentibacter sp. JX0631]
MNKLNTSIIVTLIILLTSCVTMKKKHELVPVLNDDQVLKISQIIQNRCFVGKNPQFLADFSTESLRLPPIEIEGIWEKNFSLLKSSVIGPLGTEFFSFQLDGTDISYSADKNISISNDYFEQFSLLFSKLGANGIRSFMCGEYAFKTQKSNDGLYIVKEKVRKEYSENIQTNIDKEVNNFEQNKYFSISNIDVSGKDIEVQSYVSVTAKDNGYAVAIDSKFYYGFFAHDTQIEVKWVGYVAQNILKPTSVVFRSKNQTFSIYFSEFQ